MTSAIQTKLTIEQEKAAGLLAEGKPVAEVAEQIATDAATVASWQDNPHFVAEVNRQRQAAWKSAQDRLRALVPNALQTLEEAVERGDVRASVEVLKAAGVYGKVSAPSGEVDAELVMVRQSEAWAEAELAKRGPEDDLAVLRRYEEKPELAQRRFQELRASALGLQP